MTTLDDLACVVVVASMFVAATTVLLLAIRVLVDWDVALEDRGLRWLWKAIWFALVAVALLWLGIRGQL